MSYDFRNFSVSLSVFFQLLRGLCSIHQQINLGLFYFWTGLRPVVFCFSPECFEAILKSPNNIKKSFDYTFLSLWLKEGLVTSFCNMLRKPALIFKKETGSQITVFSKETVFIFEFTFS
ncbi:UNVERIFIED_CONTAM: Cyp4c3 [Trichonephila clavipes]